MELRKVFALRGPNIWANFSVLEAWVDLGPWKDSPSDSMPGFNDRLMAWLPTMIEHRCGIGERGGFFQRLRTGTYLAHILEHVTLELQTLAGSDVGYGKARELLGEGYYKVAVEYEVEELARAALETGRRLLMAAILDQSFDVEAEVVLLRKVYQKHSLGPSTKAIVDAAAARGIPWRRLNTGSLVQFGHGVKQRRIVAAQTDRTGAVAEEIAQDKDLTRDLLSAAGIPIPCGRPVDDAADAQAAAEEIGLPVVVKPRFGNQGRGVAVNLRTLEQVAAAYVAACEESSNIVVEKFAPGDDFRVLVVGDRVIAAAKRVPAQVFGDGNRSISQLIDEVNRDPRRGEDHATSLSKIKIDAVAMGVLAEQGYMPDSVPAAGTKVVIRRNANLSTGGTAEDVTDLIHPQVAARCIEAARVIGLDIAGIDVVAGDISVPLEAQSGVIVEVNAAPGLRMHVEPSSGKPQPVGDAIVTLMYGPASSSGTGDDGRIPTVAVTGTNGKTTVTRLIAHMFARSGLNVGMTCTDGIYIGGRRIDNGDCSGPKSARNVLANPTVEAAVLETARGGILREGLGFDRCNVAVVTNIADGDHLGIAGIDTPEQIATVKRTIVDVVGPKGYAVLNADDPLTFAMAEKCKGGSIYFTRKTDLAAIGDHLAKGGRAVFVREGEIICREGQVETVVAGLDEVPLTHGGMIGFQVENALAAVAAAWGLELPWDVVRDALATFASDMQMCPGRFNLLKIGEATVVVDYGHNPSALVALIDAIEEMPHERRIAVYSAAGDRRDVDMIRQGELLGDAFDVVILYEDHYLRGRNPGDIIRLFREGADRGSRVDEVHDLQGATKSLQKALQIARPGDLLLLQADCIDETMEFMRRFLADQTPGREVNLLEALTALSDAVIPSA
jgi:cyanophycin synthetase